MANYGTGLDASIGFASETTFNQVPTSPTWRFLPLTSETINRQKKTVQSMGLRGGLIQTPLAAQRRISTREAKGNILVDVQNQNMGVLFNNMLGSSSSANTGAAYTWTHTLGGLKGKSLSVQVARPSADGVINPFNYTGGKITDWELTLDTNNLLGLNLGMDFADETTTANGPTISTITQTGTAGAVTYYYRISAVVGGVEQAAGPELSTATSNATLNSTNYNVVSWSTVTGATSYNVYRSTTSGAELKIGTSTTTSYNDQSNTAGSGAPINPLLATPSYSSVTGTQAMAPYSFTDVSTLTLGGASVAAVKKISIKSTTPAKADRFYLGSAGVKAEQVTNGYRMVAGTLDCEFVSLTALYAAYAADTQLAFVFKATQPTLISSTSTPFSLQVDIPAMFLEGDSPNVAGPDILTQSVPFVGLYDGTNSAIKITQVTADSTL